MVSVVANRPNLNSFEPVQVPVSNWSELEHGGGFGAEEHFVLGGLGKI